MPTIIDLSEQEIAELKAFTKEAEPTAAVRSAMTEYLRLARRLQLKSLSGQVTMDDNWKALEAAELRKSDGDARSGAD
ncbi:MAG TPA: hypothetical protein VGI40_25915 [Pirellulaceae bacterium]|jgi:hypothetical protein